MNILLIGFVEDFTPIIEKIFQSIDINQCIIVNKSDITFPESINGIALDYEDMRCGYYNGVDWAKIPPLDRILIEKMAGCEIETLKMIERLEGTYQRKLDYEDRKRMYYRHLRFWNYMLDHHKINVYVSSDIPHEIYDFIVYNLCKIKNIKTIMFYRMPTFPYKNVSKYILDDIKSYNTEIGESFKELMNEYQDLEDEDAIKLTDAFNAYYEAHTKRTIKPVAFIKTEALPKVKTIEKRFSTITYLLSRKRFDLFSKKIIELVNIKLRKTTRFSREKRKKTRIAQDFYENNKILPDYSQKYVFFALHYQPECTTSPMAGVFVHQLLMVQMISYCLPEDVLIYIKEHPRNDLERDIELYRDLVSMKNVRLIDKSVSSLDMIDHSLFVATGTGTAGWEAFLRKKPVMMFGYYIYQNAPGVYHIDSLEDCMNAIDRITSNPDGATNIEIKVFLKTLENIAIQGHLNNRYRDICLVSPEENVDQSADAIIKALRQIK